MEVGGWNSTGRRVGPWIQQLVVDSVRILDHEKLLGALDSSVVKRCVTCCEASG